MGKMADEVKRVAGKLGVNIPEDKMPTEEFVKQEMKELEEIELFLNYVPPQVVKGCIYFMSKGASFKEAASIAMNAKEDMDKLGLMRKEEEEKTKEEPIGVMLNV